jgi:hypothetical protein
MLHIQWASNMLTADLTDDFGRVAHHTHELVNGEELIKK